MTNPYEDLGVAPDATKDAIRKAYRRKVQKAHPDKGGSVEEFQRLDAAYVLLSDDRSRKQFDETGKVGPDPSDNWLPELAQLLARVVDTASDIDAQDVVGTMRKVLLDDCSQVQANKGLLTKVIDKRLKAIKRLRVRDGESNLLASTLENGIAVARAHLAELDGRLERLAHLQEKLSAYSYVFEAPQPQDWSFSSTHPHMFTTTTL